MEKLNSKRLEELENLIYNERQEELEMDDTQFPFMLLVIVGVALLAGTVMFIVFLGVGTEYVTQTLGTHFQKR